MLSTRSLSAALLLQAAISLPAAAAVLTVGTPDVQTSGITVVGAAATPVETSLYADSYSSTVFSTATVQEVTLAPTATSQGSANIFQVDTATKTIHSWSYNYDSFGAGFNLSSQGAGSWIQLSVTVTSSVALYGDWSLYADGHYTAVGTTPFGAPTTPALPTIYQQTSSGWTALGTTANVSPDVSAPGASYYSLSSSTGTSLSADTPTTFSFAVYVASDATTLTSVSGFFNAGPYNYQASETVQDSVTKTYLGYTTLPAVPELQSVWMLLAGLGALGLIARRRSLA